MSPALYTVPSGFPFTDALVAGVLHRTKGDALALAEQTILLPTRRACRAVREAFLRAGKGRPLLLPRLLAVGDPDESDLILTAADSLELPPVLSGLRRQLLLARLVGAMRWEERTPSPDQAVRLAASLADFLDQTQSDGVSFDALETLVPDDYANHWRLTLDFLKILTNVWPALLEEQGGMDPVARRTALLEAQAALWRKSPARHPVIAAGIDGAIPAVAALLAVVATMPTGMVVLPGLDPDIDPALWEAVGAMHPLFAMKGLLTRLGAAPIDVRLWTTEVSPRPQRGRLLTEALRPAETAEAWKETPNLVDAGALDGFYRIDCPGLREEAGTIALILREAIETEGRTAALITPDRALARRVAAEMKRFGIDVDDSAGFPLLLGMPGAFLRLLVQAVDSRFAPHDFLALLKHPLAALERDPVALRELVREVERKALRGPRPAPGIAGLREVCPDSAADWLDRLEEITRPLSEMMARESVPLGDLVRAHMECAEALATSHALPGPARLWHGEAGEATARFAAELLDAAAVWEEIPPDRYLPLFEALMSGQVVRPVWGRHPRLNIWGLLEGRLQQADVVVLGGLNEGVWPSEPMVDRWMSRPMREKFGLVPLEARIGQAAHDFMQACNAPQVYLTRSERAEGAPTIPSRWLLRLDVVLKAAGMEPLGARKTPYSHWYSLLDRPDAVTPTAPPAPTPPREARPRQLSVTQVETWMRDPYAVYARHILRLKALDPLDADPGAADYGSLMHKVLEAFLLAFPGPLPADATQKLITMGRELFEDRAVPPGVRVFWWPRFEKVAARFIECERARRATLARTFCEVEGQVTLASAWKPFTLTAKADRLDILQDGGLVLIDYKTGSPPTSKEVNAGFSPQLPLEAAIARHGGFPQTEGKTTVTELLYWRLSADGAPKFSSKEKTPQELSAEAEAGLLHLIERFDDEQTPYVSRPHPDYAPRYSDYLHLARVKEWATLGEDDA